MTQMLEYEMVELFQSLEEDRPCMPIHNECDNAATWIAIQVCCGFEIPFCDDHRIKVDEWLERVHSRGQSMTCDECGAVVPASELIKWIKIKP